MIRLKKKRGDDAAPQVEPESLVPVSRFQGSRLASGPSPSPYEQQGTESRSQVDARNKRKWTADDNTTSQAHKVARLSSGATIGAAIVEAENSPEEVYENKEELKAKLKELLREKSDAFNSANPEEDKIKLGTPGWKERYYEEKFSARSPEELEAIRRDVVLKYTEGLCWVMHYYYEGVSSWQWFYPYHYAPFASDLKELGQLDISFELGSPFKPFNQLLGVFPAASSHALPEQYRKLMTDPNSPIFDFYPIDFEVDMNGKRYSWQGIAKLPFIDEVRLLAEVEKIEHTLTEEEARRNSVMFDMLFVSSSHPLSVCIYSLDNRCKQLMDKDRAEIKEQLKPELSGGMNGYISPCAGDPCPPFFRSPVAGMEDIMNNEVLCVIYRLPDAHKHITRPPAGVVFPKKIVQLEDVKPAPTLWHEDSGRRPWENGSNSNTAYQRQNPPGTMSGRQLGDAAHRLVVNSLQYKAVDANGYANYGHAPPPYPGPLSWHQEQFVAAPPRSALHPPGFHQHPNATSSRDSHDYGHGRPHSRPTAHPRGHERNNSSASLGNGSHSRHANYPRGQYNGPSRYSPGPIQRPPNVSGSYQYQEPYNSHHSSHVQGGPPAQAQWRGGWTPRGNYNHPRGYMGPQQSSNPYSALDRRGDRQPPPPGYGRR